MKAEVRIVQSQSEEIKPANLNQYEIDELLSKYGQKSQYVKSDINPNQGLTFDQMVIQQEAKIRNEEMKINQMRNGARPISFDPNNIGYSETKYSDYDEDNLGIKVQIVSDMKIPK